MLSEYTYNTDLLEYTGKTMEEWKAMRVAFDKAGGKGYEEISNNIC